MDAYIALIENLRFINEPEYAVVATAWQERKILSHSNVHDPLFVPVFPWMLWYVLFEHNLASLNTIEMRVERTFGIDYWMNHKDTTDLQRSTMLNTTFWGKRVEEVGIVPAIYCWEREVVFAETMPDDVGEVMMAVQLVRQH